jgi:carbamoyl-phosphate synthase large subunit
MKSTGEAIGYDRTRTRAVYKALQASGMHLQNYGTVFCTIADKDKEEALPLIRRFYKLGFNIQATSGTAAFLKNNGIRTHELAKISEGSDEIPDALRQGHIAYFINTKDPGSNGNNDGAKLRQVATEYNVTMFTSLDTVDALLDVLEETTLTISTIDA